MQEMTLACPECGQVDAVQKVRSVVEAGTSTGTYAGESRGIGYIVGMYGGGGVTMMQGRVALSGGSQTLLAQRLSLPSAPTRAAGHSLSEVFWVLVWTGIGGVVLYYNATDTPGLPGYIGGGVMFFLGVLFLCMAYDDVQEASRRYEQMTPVWNRAAAIWEHLCYCHRCDGIFLPSTARLYPPESIQQYLLDVRSVPSYVGGMGLWTPPADGLSERNWSRRQKARKSRITWKVHEPHGEDCPGDSGQRPSGRDYARIWKEDEQSAEWQAYRRRVGNDAYNRALWRMCGVDSQDPYVVAPDVLTLGSPPDD